MYQINVITGELSNNKSMLDNHLEINKQQYEVFKKIEQKERLSLLDLPDLDVNSLTANKLKVGNVNSDGKTTSTTSNYIGVNELTATETFKLDAPTGSGTFSGAIKAKSLTSDTATFTVKPSLPGQDGKPSTAASMSDIAAASKGITNIVSTDKSIKPVITDSVADLSLTIATALQLGGVKVPAGGAIKIDAVGNLTIDGAISPIKSLGLWDASKNDPKFDETTAIPDTFLITHVRGTQTFPLGGTISFEVGDWLLAQEEIGGKVKAVKVPMSDALTQITASMIKAGILGKGIEIDTDQTIKTSKDIVGSSVSSATANVTDTLTVKNIIITGSLTGQA